MNLTWINSPPMRADQLADLRSFLEMGVDEPLTITPANVVWAATKDEEADWRVNFKLWWRFADAAEADGRRYRRMPFIAGVFFPAVAMASRLGNVMLLTPVSSQGEGQTPVHIRWARY
jgi:hypothetical protein